MDDIKVMSIIKEIKDYLCKLPVDKNIELQNKIKVELHSVSPLKNEPADCVVWVKHENVYANDYNPNSVAPPEMKLLIVSIDSDGYTQPIVTMPCEKGHIVIDGFHRHKVGKEIESVKNRVFGYLPIVEIRHNRENRDDRIASTIRHNRARGKHLISEMSNIVAELAKKNWSDEKISKELGMDADEVLRLKQITGLAELFSDEEFSEAWE
jgi:ParB-like chromosome segregation protein Spo0J